MRIHNVCFASIGICSAALFFACGDNSFDGTATNDGGADGAAADGLIDGSSDGNGSVDAITADATPCTKEIIFPMAAKQIDCPTTPGEVGSSCDVSTGTCCFNGDNGNCETGNTSCGGDDLKWQCEKPTDCAAFSTCCLSVDAGAPSGCTPTGDLISSTCSAATVCVPGSARMCVTDNDCAIEALAKTCQPIYVRFAADQDGGVLVGTCVP